MFARLNVCLVLIGIGLFSLVACQPQEQIGIQAEMNGIPYRVVSVQELQTMLEDKDFTMINVHTPWEGDIPDTDVRLAYDQIEQNTDKLPADKDAKILVYCLTSGMAKKAVATLLVQGYTNVWMLEGGTTAWQEAGLMLESQP
ncbi:MAG: rhodanese-like domain-containing protein [Anaerolineales bacterium]|nr:rhodanese-like domain-containing protein [Chloroflexota bacterium]MBI5704999.1 rhodanese-like domain-containing protein [Chloroflexota bacterium]MBX3037459.1 rhodanese-like domain-containing protein [Anaerolineales bacterium]HNC08131.1 rhodanese-like domain-containing protein [Anaerolineales bacterium]HND47203.1 rhodanese-like domain-containing protein [Anaerolineales bacterium]